jgi:hypothetical protein
MPCSAMADAANVMLPPGSSAYEGQCLVDFIQQVQGENSREVIPVRSLL